MKRLEIGTCYWHQMLCGNINTLQWRLHTELQRSTVIRTETRGKKQKNPETILVTKEMCIANEGLLFICRFPLLLQLLLLQSFSGLIAQQCNSEESIFGTMLQRHIFKIIKPSSSLHCLQACNGDVRCQSFNYDFSDDICELNNHTKEDKPEDFIPNFTRYYYGKARKRGL